MKKQSFNIPGLSSENGVMSGGFSVLDHKQMLRIKGGVNNTCLNKNDCTKGTHNQCTNTGTCYAGGVPLEPIH